MSEPKPLDCYPDGSIGYCYYGQMKNGKWGMKAFVLYRGVCLGTANWSHLSDCPSEFAQSLAACGFEGIGFTPRNFRLSDL